MPVDKNSSSLPGYTKAFYWQSVESAAQPNVKP